MISATTPNDAAEHVDVPAQQVERGKARSLAPIISGSRKFPSTAGIDGDQEEEDHHHAVHGEQLVVGLGLDAGRPRGVSSSSRDRSSANRPPSEEQDRDRDQVQDRDALVVVRQQPRLEAVAVVQVVPFGQLCSVSSMAYSSLAAGAFVASGGRGRRGAASVAVGDSDLMYSMQR